MDLASEFKRLLFPLSTNESPNTNIAGNIASSGEFSSSAVMTTRAACTTTRNNGTNANDCIVKDILMSFNFEIFFPMELKALMRVVHA